MSLLGKLLLVVSLLTMGGFAYLAIQDWQGRQKIAGAGLRHLILLQGLPLGDRPGDPADMPTDPEAEIPFGFIGPGGMPSDTVSPALLKAYFVNDPVPNQLAEVKRRYELVKSDIDKLDGAAAKAPVAGRWLLPLAETIEERAEVQQWIATGAGDKLANRLFQKFDQVRNPPKQADLSALGTGGDPKEQQAKAAELRIAAVKDEPERRARLAHLLIFLDASPEAQKRALQVVGMRRYVNAVVAQTLRVRDMTARVERWMNDDQQQFVEQYAQLRGLSIERTQMVKDMTESRARIQEQARKDNEFVEQRKSQLADLAKQLAVIKKEVDVLLAAQEAAEKSMFLIQREVGLTLEDIYRLEAELTKREQERYQPK